MKKHFLVLALILLSFSGYAQYSMFEPALYVRPYTVALNIASPTSLMVKYGGGLEYRRRRTSYMYGYYKFVGAYYGEHMDLEFRVYTGKYWQHKRYHYTYQDFFYGRLIMGAAAYDGEKFAFLGQKEKEYSIEQLYLGGAAGFGRRYARGRFFASIKGGIRAVKLPDLDPGVRSLYRTFFVTGPGSIVEINAHFGVAF